MSGKIRIGFLDSLCNSIGSIQDLRTGGRWFDTRFDQYLFRASIVVIATGIIPPPRISIVSTIILWESSQWFGKNIVWSLVRRSPGHDCTGRRDITETLLKTTKNNVQSILRACIRVTH